MYHIYIYIMVIWGLYVPRFAVTKTAGRIIFDSVAEITPVIVYVP